MTTIPSRELQADSGEGVDDNKGITLKPRWAKVLKVLYNYPRVKGYPPCFREIMKDAGMSRGGLEYAMLRMKLYGYMDFIPNSDRTATITPAGINYLLDHGHLYLLGVNCEEHPYYRKLRLERANG